MECELVKSMNRRVLFTRIMPGTMARAHIGAPGEIDIRDIIAAKVSCGITQAIRVDDI